MTQYMLRFFGRFSIHRDDRRVASGGTAKERALLAYLALARGRFVARDVLATAFWGELPQSGARRSLSTALWRMKKILASAGLPAETLIVSDGDGVRLTPGTVTIDVLDFTDALEPLLRLPPDTATEDHVARLEQAVALCRGAFLEGIYDDWSLSQREILAGRHQSALEHLLRCYETQGRAERVIALGRTLLDRDPLLEPLHRAVIRCHLARGDRSRALQQFIRCAKALRVELDVAPMRETTALVAHLLPGHLRAGRLAVPPRPKAPRQGFERRTPTPA